MKSKIIFITGGVLSSLGKGVAAAAIGALLESRGLRVTFQKLDPYINVDPGTCGWHDGTSQIFKSKLIQLDAQ